MLVAPGGDMRALFANADSAVMVAVTIVWVMEMPIDDVVHMTRVRNSSVSTRRTMNVLARVTIA